MHTFLYLYVKKIEQIKLRISLSSTINISSRLLFSSFLEIFFFLNFWIICAGSAHLLTNHIGIPEIISH